MAGSAGWRGWVCGQTGTAPLNADLLPIHVAKWWSGLWTWKLMGILWTCEPEMWCFGACRKIRPSCEDEDVVVSGSFVGHWYWSLRWAWRRLWVHIGGLLCSLISELGLHSGSFVSACSIPEMKYSRKCRVCSGYPVPWGIHCSGNAYDTWNS